MIPTLQNGSKIDPALQINAFHTKTAFYNYTESRVPSVASTQNLESAAETNPRIEVVFVENC